MKLYIYDHCPYCVKARMIFGFKNVPVEIVTLLNDDEKTPTEMIGKKMLPILEFEDGQYLAESLDIIQSIDKNQEFGNPMVSKGPESMILSDWLATSRQYTYALAMPRWVVMGLEEFATKSAIEYFTEKKFSSIGPFEQNLCLTSSLISYAENHLQELENIYKGGTFFWGNDLTWDDFHVFATLRCLTTVKGLKFPEKLNHYMNRLSDRSRVPLHWDLALGGNLS